MSDTSPAAIRDMVLTLLEHPVLPQVVQLGHPVLRRQALPYDGQLAEAELQQLIALMRRVMHAAPGVGVAAPQLGIPLQLAVLEDRFAADPDAAAARDREPLAFFAILNPRYSPLGARTASFYEGCLSFTGFQAVVERHHGVQLDYLSPEGCSRTEEFHGWAARIVQHEVDHLNGTVYIDKALTRSLASNSEYSLRWAQPTIDRARHDLGF